MKTWHWFGVAVLFGLLAVAGCRNAAESSATKEYDVKATIVRVAADKTTVTLDHEDIKGFMKAMTMEFRVEDPKLLDGFAPGDQIEGRLKVTSDHPGGILTGLKKSSVSAAKANEAEITAARSKLTAADLALVQAQDICPISDERLGSMGKPFKLMLKDRPVFLCCDGCEDEAREDPDKTLAKVEELKAKTKSTRSPK